MVGAVRSAVRSAKVHAPTKPSVTRHQQHDRHHSEIEPAVVAAGWLLEDHGEQAREGGLLAALVGFLGGR